MSLAPWSMCHIWKIWKLAIKNRKMHFYQSFGVTKFLTWRGNGSQKALPNGNLALKISYLMEIWLSKLLTGREFGFQKHYQAGIGLSKSLTGWESGHDMTKMHFSIFIAEISHMTTFQEFIKEWLFAENMSFNQFFCVLRISFCFNIRKYIFFGNYLFFRFSDCLLIEENMTFTLNIIVSCSFCYVLNTKIIL